MNDDVLNIEQLNEATAILTLNRPECRNALSIELLESLCAALESFAAQTQFRILVLRGAGASFCSGLDLVEASNAEVAERSALAVARTFQTLADFPLIAIAAVHGAAYAGGAGLMACCDFVVAAEDLRVCFPETRRGLVPALAAVALGARLREGERRELLLLGEPIDARRALSIGLVDRVVPPAQLMVAAAEIADAVLKGAPEAVRQTKRLLRDLAHADHHHLFAKALEFHCRARASAEAEEGLAAFREKREPRWDAGIE